ncbi:MAG: archaemetzincin [Leadbetterella sp.]
MVKFTTCIALHILLISCSYHSGRDQFNDSDFEYFKKVKKNDIELNTTKEGEWLYGRNEKGQTFDQYFNAHSKKVYDNQHQIYLLPLGKFTPLQDSVIKLTQEYLSIFYQRKVIILDKLSDRQIPESKKRIREDGNIQILASHILEPVLTNVSVTKSLALMAIAEKDIYPKDDWNYVFGLASYHKRIGVTSIYQLEDTKLEAKNFKTCLKRLINVSSHEIGHMFSIRHCIAARCIMNGSNSITEIDSAPNRACSECQKKICYALKFNNQKRLTELSDFFKKYDLKEDYAYIQRDRDLFK